jgi:ABC-type Fe3+ transport system permease subunit
MMRRMQSRPSRWCLAWSTLLLAITIAIVAQAVWSLYAAGQACFFEYPQTPCPDVHDPAFGRLIFAITGIPLTWFAGICVASLARTARRRGRAAR